MNVRDHRKKMKKMHKDLSLHMSYIMTHQDKYPADYQDLFKHLMWACAYAYEASRFMEEHWQDMEHQIQIKEKIHAV